MSAIASPITSLMIVCSTVYSGADQRKHRSSASLAFVREIHRWSVNSPHKGPVTREMFPFDGVIIMFTHLHDSSGPCPPFALVTHWNGNIILKKLSPPAALKLSEWQLSMQPMAEMSSKRQHSRFNARLNLAVIAYLRTPRKCYTVKIIPGKYYVKSSFLYRISSFQSYTW